MAVRGLIGVVEVSQISGLLKRQVYALAKKDMFPKPMRLGDRYVWDEEEVRRHIAEYRRELAQRPICYLFPREKEVLRLAAQGLKTKEIANRLRLTRSAVESAKYRAYLKLNVDNIRDALIRANDLGVLE